MADLGTFMVFFSFVMIFVGGFFVGLASSQVIYDKEYRLMQGVIFNDSLVDCNIRVDSMRMLYKEQYNLSYDPVPVDGVAFGDFFAVWTRGRNITSVLEVCAHEYAHNNLGLIDK